MPRKQKTSPVVELAEIRMARTMAATQHSLVPDAAEALSAEELSRRVAEQLAALPDKERTLLRHKVLSAVHDLEGLVDTLQEQMNGLAQELRKVTSHTQAATAYGRSMRNANSNRP